MKKTGKSWNRLVSFIMILALTLTGCGANTDNKGVTDNETMTQFTSEDGSVTIETPEQWKQEDCSTIVGDDTYSWLTAGWIMLTDKNNAMLMVAQYPKDLLNIHDLDSLKQTFSSLFLTTDVKTVDSPTVSQMEVWETDTCKITDDSGAPGELLVLYGKTEYAHYIILYAAPSKINEADTALFNQVCTSFKENAPETENTASAELSDTLRWFNNTFAILIVQNEWDFSFYSGLPKDDYGKSMAEYLLTNTWGVTDRASADETLDWLLEEGHRIPLAEELELLTSIGLADTPAEERAETILANFELDEKQAQRYADWFTLYEQYDTDTAAGWDYSRAMTLLSFYYLTGLYTEEETLNRSLEIAKTIQTTFDSWDDFMESYFIGYEYGMEADSEERREIYEQLRASSDNPFDLDWNITLEKSW